MLLIQTYVIEDCYKYNNSISYTGNSNSQICGLSSIQTPYSITGKLSSTKNAYAIVCDYQNIGFRIGVGGNNNRDVAIFRNNNWEYYNIDTYTSYSTPFSFEFKVYSDRIEFYVGDVLRKTDYQLPIPTSVSFSSWNTSKTVTITNFKIKPL